MFNDMANMELAILRLISLFILDFKIDMGKRFFFGGEIREKLNFY